MRLVRWMGKLPQNSESYLALGLACDCMLIYPIRKGNKCSVRRQDHIQLLHFIERSVKKPFDLFPLLRCISPKTMKKEKPRRAIDACLTFDHTCDNFSA